MDQRIISRYIGQPARLPSDVRARIEHACDGRSIQLYALADLDDALTLGVAWLALGPDHLALARSSAAGDLDVEAIERRRIRAVRETPGLSANTLMLLGE